jgi:hypothetical protein
MISTAVWVQGSFAASSSSAADSIRERLYFPRYPALFSAAQQLSIMANRRIDLASGDTRLRLGQGLFASKRRKEMAEGKKTLRVAIVATDDFYEVEIPRFNEKIKELLWGGARQQPSRAKAAFK